MARLGIVAGSGVLPGRLIAACREAGREFHVLALEDNADAREIGDAPADWVRVEALSEALAVLRRERIDELVLAGGVARPPVTKLMRDPRAAALMLRAGARILGDDALLSSVTGYLEEKEGFRIVPPERLLGDVLATEGCLGTARPGPDEKADVARAVAVARELGRLDIGQAVVVQNGTVLAVEAAEGTDRLIARCGALVRRGDPGGVLVKMAKPGQDRRVDLPAVGAGTVERAAGIGLRGIAMEAGGALLVGRRDAIAAADRLGVFLVGVPPAGGTGDAAAG